VRLALPDDLAGRLPGFVPHVDQLVHMPRLTPRPVGTLRAWLPACPLFRTAPPGPKV
jgi:hypothetical protein